MSQAGHIYFEGLNFTFCECDDGFLGLWKACHYPFQLLTIILNEITYLFWKCLLKPSSEFPSMWLIDVIEEGRAASKGPSASGMNQQNPQEANWKHFQCENRRFRVFEAGYWKAFQNRCRSVEDYFISIFFILYITVSSAAPQVPQGASAEVGNKPKIVMTVECADHWATISSIL